MILVTLILQLNIHPALERARLLAGRSGAAEEEASARQALRRLTALNLGLGILVLLLTAMITAL